MFPGGHYTTQPEQPATQRAGHAVLAAINLPPLPPNDNGDYNYSYSATVYYDTASTHYRMAVSQATW